MEKEIRGKEVRREEEKGIKERMREKSDSGRLLARGRRPRASIEKGGKM